ncbi:MAG TPA: OmpA family protein [Saprospiraceae bacterium]|nr:OmpA family protein [Saprospiraceae bacterium]
MNRKIFPVFFSVFSLLFACKPAVEQKTTTATESTEEHTHTAPPAPVLTKDVSDAISQLSDITPGPEMLSGQIMDWIKSGEYDLGNTFKFMSIRWKGQTTEWIDSTLTEVDQLARIMTQFPKMQVSIEAYTDNNGDDKANERLTQQKVDKIKSRLVSAGIDASRIKAKGMGEKLPVGDNKTMEGQLINNRIELYLTRFNQ